MKGDSNTGSEGRFRSAFGSETEIWEETVMSSYVGRVCALKGQITVGCILFRSSALGWRNHDLRARRAEQTRWK